MVLIVTKVSEAFYSAALSPPDAAAFQTLLGLGTAQKSTEYERIRGAKNLQPQDIGLC